MEVFGYIRFSYMGRSDVRLYHNAKEDQEEYFRKLYDPNRMEVRFHFFEKLCLPSLKSQSDQKFRLFVLASDAMPNEYKSRLEAATADISQIEIHYSDKPVIHEVIAPLAEEATKNLEENSIHFRLDDDDAIGVDVVKNLRVMGAGATEQTILSMPKGFLLFSYQGKPFLLPKQEPYIAIAYAFACPPRTYKNPFACAHRKHAQANLSFVDPRNHAYIHAAHTASDTHQNQDRKFLKHINNNPNFDDVNYQKTLRASFEKAFPSFSFDEILDAMQNAPAMVHA